MKRRDPATERQLHAIIEQGRRIRRMPDIVRARLLSRARAVIGSARLVSDAPPPSVIPAPWRRARSMAAAAAVLLAAAGATAALRVRALRVRDLPPTAYQPPAGRLASAPALTRPPAPPALPDPVRLSRASLPRGARALSPKESYAAEVGLLQGAQSDYARRDFRGALVLVAEHAHRFPKGRLAEEREALRIRSLAGAGRPDEARRALESFARHFPRSALLPRLQAAAGNREE